MGGKKITIVEVKFEIENEQKGQFEEFCDWLSQCPLSKEKIKQIK